MLAQRKHTFKNKFNNNVFILSTQNNCCHITNKDLYIILNYYSKIYLNYNLDVLKSLRSNLKICESIHT